jgi:hypothetical protein
MNMCPIPNGFRDRAIWLYSGLAWASGSVLPSRHATPLSEACDLCEASVALMLRVEFSNIYYKLYQLCHLNNKYCCYKQYILVITLSYHQFCGLHSNGFISETVRNRTHVYIKLLLRMTDTMTSQNIDLSSCNTPCRYIYIYIQM